MGSDLKDGTAVTQYNKLPIKTRSSFLVKPFVAPVLSEMKNNDAVDIIICYELVKETVKLETCKMHENIIVKWN